MTAMNVLEIIRDLAKKVTIYQCHVKHQSDLAYNPDSGHLQVLQMAWYP